MKIVNKNNGFTLIELAMVLFILSLLLGSLLTPLATSIEQSNREGTNKTLEDIRDSLTGYALVNGHLPCPDCPDNTTGNCNLAGIVSDDGIEDGVNTSIPTATNDRANANFLNCATTAGYIPWVTLNVSGNDAWDHRLIYSVTDGFADKADGTGSCTNPSANMSFCLDSASDADIDIDDETGVAIAQNVPAVVISVGNNFDDSYASLSAAEKANLDNFNGSYPDRTFVSADYIQTAGSEFDDLLIWITPSSLMYQMVRAERLP